ncbi:MAG TPA: GtrA family protein, partial [Sphingomonas sp.]|nr:GtrA family protein [Sphingomonas sp.]
MVTKLLQHLNSSGVMGQLIRYAITGGGVTLLGAGLYLALVTATPIHPQAAMAAAYLVCVAVGYVLHSRWSFRGHGTRDN